MDPDRMEMIVAAVAGMSAEEIEALLMASAHAGEIQNPKLLAAYLASQAGG